MKDELDDIRNLVGNINKDNLKYVDYYVEKDFGLFIPVVGFCEYAVVKGHVHPSYSFIVYFNNNSLFPSNVIAENNEYLVQGISPEFPHEEKIGEKFNSFTVNKSIMEYIERYISEYECSMPSKENILKSISTIITNDLIRGILNLDFNRDIGVKRLEIEKIINYMHQNFSDKITVSKLACLCNISESSLNKAFKEELLCSPIEYLINIRLDKAKKLLRSKSKSITEIALECGFSSLSHFSSCFTKANNISPRNYVDGYK